MAELKLGIDALQFQSRGPLAVLTLNSPQTLNALTLEMIQSLESHLRSCAVDPAVQVVVLQGAGEKSFCAGGDVKKVILSSSQEVKSRYPLDFFVSEYRVDYMIHVFPKPILVLGHGIIMGGGLGLMSGASCRAITETAQLAMPEISIGLYPDVGGSYFLSRLPGHLGLYLGLTATRLNSRDAIDLGFADFMIRASDREAILEELVKTPWTDSPAKNRVFLRKSLQNYAAEVRHAPESQVRLREVAIEELMSHKPLLALAHDLRLAQGSVDPWIAAGAQAFTLGCPTSAALILEQWKRGKSMSLADCFRMELDLSLNCVARPNFSEGVRSRLIDKDQSPKWSPATIEEITAEWVDEHFRSPWTKDTHPFKDLEKSVPH